MREEAIAMDSVAKRFGNNASFKMDLSFIKRNLDKEASECSKLVRRFTSTHISA
jgi:hypothetical protein